MKLSHTSRALEPRFANQSHDSKIRTPPSALLATPKSNEGRRASSGFTLIEILVVSVLLTVIILGLLAMFQQTQKAFRVGLTQTDVLESGRATTHLLARELELIRPANSAAVNFYASIRLPRHEQDLPGPPRDPTGAIMTRTNYFEEMFFLTRSNQYWIGIGYSFGGPAIRSGIGSLYRYEKSSHLSIDPQWMYYDFLKERQWLTNLSRIADGITHFKIQAYDLKGFRLAYPDPQIVASSRTNCIITFNDPLNLVPGEVWYYQLSHNVVPAFIDFELAILEPRAQERVRSLSDTPSVATAYLEQQAGRVHVFRQRVTVRNVDPSVYP